MLVATEREDRKLECLMRKTNGACSQTRTHTYTHIYTQTYRHTLKHTYTYTHKKNRHINTHALTQSTMHELIKILFIDFRKKSLPAVGKASHCYKCD